MIGWTVGGHTLGILRIEVKHVNHKSCVHQISECKHGRISAGVHRGGSTMQGK